MLIMCVVSLFKEAPDSGGRAILRRSVVPFVDRNTQRSTSYNDLKPDGEDPRGMQPAVRFETNLGGRSGPGCPAGVRERRWLARAGCPCPGGCWTETTETRWPAPIVQRSERGTSGAAWLCSGHPNFPPPQADFSRQLPLWHAMTSSASCRVRLIRPSPLRWREWKNRTTGLLWGRSTGDAGCPLGACPRSARNTGQQFNTGQHGTKRR